MKTERFIRRLFAVGCFAISAACLNAAEPAPVYPTWWAERGMIETGRPVNDFAVANLGQLKWFASKARDEMNGYMPGGAGAAVETMVGSFTVANSFGAVNIGQLKAVAKPIYDRLIAEGYATAYPWTTGTTADDNDFAVANVGQLKNVFTFDLRKDLDGDGLADGWELRYFGNLDHTGKEDADGDGISNADEMVQGTNPTDPASSWSKVSFSDGTAIRPKRMATDNAVSVSVKLTPPAASPVQLLVKVVGGTATRGTDYTFEDQVVSFGAGESLKAVTFTVKADLTPNPILTSMLGVTVNSGPAVALSDANLTVLIYPSDASKVSTRVPGIPDWWVNKYFAPGDPNAGADKDPDLDGLNNMMEYQLGTNPLVFETRDVNDTLGLRVFTPLR